MILQFIFFKEKGVLLMNTLITGGCGFIGSHILDRLIKLDNYIIVIDDLSSGNLRYINKYIDDRSLLFIKADLKVYSHKWVKAFKDIELVFHYAANPEVRVSVTEPKIHFNENILSTFNVLEACRKYDVKYFIFASSSTVYGDSRVIPTPEDYHPLEPISIYGASKLAAENLIITYSKLYGIRSLIIRYANIIGPRSNHGVIIDFINKLKKDPYKLEILGDGRQKKSYLYISDAVDATIHLVNIFKESSKEYEIYNVGSRDWITVNEIADIITNEMNLKGVKYIYKSSTKDGRGWPGDVKFMLLDTKKLESTGWRPRLNSRESVIKTVRDILKSNIL